MNLKPNEQKQQTDNDDDKDKTNQQVNDSENVENVKSLDSDGSKEMTTTEENKVVWDDGDELLNKFEMLCSNLDLGTWISQDTSISTTTNSVSSSSVSLDDTTTSHISIDESSYFQHNSLHQWVDNMDSILSWDAFNSLDQDISFFEK